MPLYYNIEDLECPACGKLFAAPKSRNSHLAQDKSCKWYKQGKIRDLSDAFEAMDPSLFQSSPPPSPQFDQGPIQWGDELDYGLDDDNWPDELDFADNDPLNIQEDDYDLIPNQPQEGPGPSTQASQSRQRAQSRALDEDDKDCYIEIHPTAGQIKVPASSSVDKQRDTNMLDPFSDIIMQDTTKEPDLSPFNDELDFGIAEWAVKESIGHNSFDRLLQIPGVVEKLGLSFHNVRSLHQKVDSLSDQAGEWKTRRFAFQDHPNDKYTLHLRDPVEAIKTLFADLAHNKHLVYAPKKVYTNASKTTRVYNEMPTAKWWHILQSKLPVGATLAPIIIATDRTQLTQFSGNKSAYPVYLTIGNLPKSYRQKPSNNACILIAYLSVEKLNCSEMTDLEHRSCVQCIFHKSMRIVLEPLKKAGKEGVLMKSATGDQRQVHPVLVCYVADYPEQCLVTCTKYGTCPKCKQVADKLQDFKHVEARTASWTETIIQNAKELSNGKLTKFHKSYIAITPDVLHQLYQGVFKHLVTWCQTVLNEKVLDQRIRALPLAHGLRCFKNSISLLAQISGPERKNMAKILLGCVQDVMAPSGVKAVKAILDFIFLAQYPLHNDITLGYLRDALKEFHNNKDYFIHVGCRAHLDLPKIHSLLHYVESIELFGTTDNYNTETFERFHISFAKQGWRATNQRDEFPQMTRWLSRQEKITAFRQNLDLQRAEIAPEPTTTFAPSKQLPISLAKKPHHPDRAIQHIKSLHNAPDFERHLKLFLNTYFQSPLTARQAEETTLPFASVNTYNSFRFQPQAIQDEDEDNKIIRAIPSSKSSPDCKGKIAQKPSR
ncbi:hypothetical protein CPB83DRAFT_895492 [Crepidotus variabilis]|uniref:C2H2-type domain-containing protein n=1 Tax=Crepidotus variabilis TaxID=179855 RepID=A0A9P6EDH9_9AGAR|nr:hypothetical protein CPB83DRAFT_895492 [Crepidotus variabilis]